MKRIINWITQNSQWVSGLIKRAENYLKFGGSSEKELNSKDQVLNIATSKYATVIIPALNEAKRIAEVVSFALSDPATAEVIVVDDSSIDATVELASQAGAKVIRSSMLGKGASMCDGISHASQDILVYLDGDLTGLRPGIITDLCVPLLNSEADFVKARFGRGGGRVTELTAKPMLKIFFPELAKFSQPLGGIIAARKKLLHSLSFEDGYGVDIALLIDAHIAGAQLAEVDIGSLEHDSQPLLDLALMANEVGRVIFSRAKSAGRLHVEQISAMYEAQRQATAGIDYVLTRRKGRQRLLLLDMDGTITTQRFAVELARETGNTSVLADLLDGQVSDVATRSAQISNVFKYVHKRKFEQVAHSIVLRPDVIEFVNRMKRRGFMVGVVSDSYFVAAEIIRRRIFADFAMAHTISFENDVCTGNVRMNPAFLPTDDSLSDPVCKSNVLRRFLADQNKPKVNLTWTIGDNINDLELMKASNKAFAIEPKSSVLRGQADITVINSFSDVFDLIPDHELVENSTEATVSI